MKSYFILIIFILFSVPSSAEDEANCSEDEIYTGKLFQLDINYSFKGAHQYKFCVGEKSSFLISKFTEHLPQNLPDLIHTHTVKLTFEITEKLKVMYQNAMINLPEDNSSGADGSTWCFKPKSGLSHSTFCYWAPQANTSDRGLSKLYNLKLYIQKLSRLD